MTNEDFSFEDWFSVLQSNVLDSTGVNFRDADSVREDYDDGKDVYDVSDAIIAEYDPDTNPEDNE